MLELETRLKDIVVKLFEINALKFGDFKMKVGVNSPVYFDLRVVVSYPELMEQISVLLWEFCQGEVACDHVCGVPYTALPIATLISSRFRIPMLIRRKETKQYGTRRLVEGSFAPGDRCVIVEDVVTSGSSILETRQDLRAEGLSVTHALVVVDRQQGGAQALQQHGLSMLSLLTLSKIMHILCEAGRVDRAVVESVTTYLSRTQFDGSNFAPAPEKPLAGAGEGRLRMPLQARAELARSPVAARLLRLMARKQTTLCVAADVTTASELLELAGQVGPHVCLLKTHADILGDFGEAAVAGLLQLARRHDFLLLEDRKFADIGHVVQLQYSQGPHRIASWADLVTAHPVSGEAVLTGLSAALAAVGPEVQRGCFLVAEMSSQGHLASPDYLAATTQLAERQARLVCGLVCQSPGLLRAPGQLQLTPGVRLETASDGLGQCYHSPREAVLERGADVAVVGRGVTRAEDPGAAARRYRDLLWAAYLQRVGLQAE
ncbi:uridine 5'-monophosphate synthase [Bacillus rossius redtenbacheri]|uniref:uridine 5'-monophosphate synthase n=1 Tax=Bacillus rossius redtenbacheri TaxID=93214 RepID=UPI002FDDA919